jgi:hypothetical protein
LVSASLKRQSLIVHIQEKTTATASAIPSSGIQMEHLMEIVKGKPVFLIDIGDDFSLV